MNQRFHEDFGREEEIKQASERSFGLLMATVAVIVALFKLWHASYSYAALWAGIALALALLAFLRPKIYVPFNRAWTKLGLLMFYVINPLVMFIMFLVAIVPIGLIMRLFGKDPLRRRLDPNAETYWITRKPAGPSPESMAQQF